MNNLFYLLNQVLNRVVSSENGLLRAYRGSKNVHSRNALLYMCIAGQNQQNGMCAQRRLRSAWASAQSDQSLRCPHEESLGP